MPARRRSRAARCWTNDIRRSCNFEEGAPRGLAPKHQGSSVADVRVPAGRKLRLSRARRPSRLSAPVGTAHRRLRRHPRPVVLPARVMERGRSHATRAVRARRHDGADHLIALRGMEKSGLILRRRSTDDKRRSHVWLTAKAQRMRKGLLALARGITEEAEAGVSRGDLLRFRRAIARMTANLDRIKR